MNNLKRILTIFLFIFTFTTAFSYADSPDFVIKVINESEVKTMTDILTAVSQILYSDSSNGENLDYDSLLRLIFLFGSFLVFSNVIFATSGHLQGLTSYVKYNAIVVAILTFIYSSTATVMITTNNISDRNLSCPNSPSVVTTDFVVLPYVLAYGIKVMDSIGTNLTYMFETAMYQPQGGMGTPAILDGGYGQNIKATENILSISPADVPGYQGLHHDLSVFLNECISKGLYSSGVGQKEVLDLYKSNEMMSYITDNIINSSDPKIKKRMENIMILDSNGVYKSCSDVWNNNITTTKMKSMINKYTCSPNQPVNVEGSFDYLMKDTLNSQSSIYSNSKDLIMQAAMINATRSSAKASSLGIKGAEYAVGKTKAELTTNAMFSSNYMMEMLPYMTIVFKGLIYAVFPFILILMLLPGGTGIFIQYLKSVLWIQMWMPTAAILNYFIYGYTESQAQLVAIDGLTMATDANLLSSSASLAGVAGLLYLSIPAVSWLFLTGSAQMIGNLTGEIGGSVLKNSQSDAVAKDMQSLQTQKTANKLSGKDMSIAEAENYNARMQGAAIGGSIAGNKMSGGIDAGGYASLRQETLKNLTASEKQKAGVSVKSEASLEVANKVQSLAEARSKGTLNGDDANINISKEMGKMSGTKAKGEFGAYRRKFDTNGDGIISGDELKNFEQFEQDTKTVDFINKQAILNGINSLDGKMDENGPSKKDFETYTDQTTADKTSKMQELAAEISTAGGYDNYVKVKKGLATIGMTTNMSNIKAVASLGGDKNKIDAKSLAKLTEAKTTDELSKLKETLQKNKTTGGMNKTVEQVEKTTNLNMKEQEGKTDNVTGEEAKKTSAVENIVKVAKAKGTIEASNIDPNNPNALKRVAKDQKTKKRINEKKEILQSKIETKDESGTLLSVNDNTQEKISKAEVHQDLINDAVEDPMNSEALILLLGNDKKALENIKYEKVVENGKIVRKERSFEDKERIIRNIFNNSDLRAKQLKGVVTKKGELVDAIITDDYKLSAVDNKSQFNQEIMQTSRDLAKIVKDSVGSKDYDRIKNNFSKIGIDLDKILDKKDINNLSEVQLASDISGNLNSFLKGNTVAGAVVFGTVAKIGKEGLSYGIQKTLKKVAFKKSKKNAIEAGSKFSGMSKSQVKKEWKKFMKNDEYYNKMNKYVNKKEVFTKSELKERKGLYKDMKKIRKYFMLAAGY